MSYDSGDEVQEQLPTGSFSQPKGIWGYRYLIWNFAKRDLKARFNGTAAGWAWSLVVPVAQVATYSLVFGLIFGAPAPDFGNGREAIFAVWFVCGLVPWTFFTNALLGSMGQLLAAGSLLQKIYIPSYVPVLGTIGGVLVQTLIEFAIVLAILLFYLNLGWSWLLLPIWLAIFLIFTASLSYIIAVLNVFFRDLSQIVGVVVQLLFYATPIIYPPSKLEDVSPRLAELLLLNPLADFVIGFRDILYQLQPPPADAWIAVAIWTAVTLLLAVLVGRWRGRDVGENI